MTIPTSIERDVKQSLLNRSKAERVFQPWWDVLKDYVLTILIGIGRLLSGKTKCPTINSIISHLSIFLFLFFFFVSQNEVLNLRMIVNFCVRTPFFKLN